MSRLCDWGLWVWELAEVQSSGFRSLLFSVVFEVLEVPGFWGPGLSERMARTAYFGIPTSRHDYATP